MGEPAAAALAALAGNRRRVALSIATIVNAVFDPAEQRVEALAETSAGDLFLLSSTYRDLAPGAPAALAAFVARQSGGFVVGRAKPAGGIVVVEPMLLLGETVVVPDLAEFDDAGRRALGRMSGDHQSEADGLLANAASLSASLTMEGTASPERWLVAADQTAGDLRRAGLSKLANPLVAASVGQQRWAAADGTALADVWADAAIAICLGRER